MLHEINTDVLVIGSGGAGLFAAIAARENGADVLVVGKARPGRSNNTAISGGVFAVVTGLKGTNDTKALHINDTLVSGRFVNNKKMISTMVKGAYEQTKNLLNYGVELQRKNHKDFWVIHVPGHCVPRHLFTKNSFGTDYTLPIVSYAGKKSIKFLSRVFVERLLTGENGQVSGALICDHENDRFILVNAKSVVLAAGGGGRIYSRTNNAPGITGDGYCLGFRIGIPLIDMEFVQFYPTLLFEQGLPNSLVAYEVFIFRGNARLFNAKGEDVALRNNITEPSSMTRDILTRAIANEINEGRGVNGGVILDVSRLPLKKIEKYQRFLPKSLKGRKRFVISPAVHHCMGGLMVNHRGETGIEGLYSAGEVNGGLHGANRLGGNALTEAWVYGNLTGFLAAEFAKKVKTVRHGLDIDDVCTEIGTNFNYTDSEDITFIYNKFRDSMWNNAGIIRLEEQLTDLIETINTLKVKLQSCTVKNYKELVKKLELKNMLLVGEAIAISSLARKESRGSHFRADYPYEGGDNWVKNIIVNPDDLEY